MNTHPSIRALIFDLDGTLVDSNAIQAEAWLIALRDSGYEVGRDRIEKEIGKGGDQLVKDLLGESIDKKHGNKLRKAQPRAAEKLIDKRGVKAFAGAIQILKKSRERGLKVALATSSGKSMQIKLLEEAGIDPELFDVLVTGDDADATKPEADLYHAAIDQLKLSPGECLNVGDTPYDCIAARRAGLVTIGLDGELNSAQALREAGARVTYAGCATLLRKFDVALNACSPRTFALTGEKMMSLMQNALAAARLGMQKGEVPIGAVLVDPAGDVIARGFNSLNQTRDKTTHAEIIAFRELAGKIDPNTKGLTLVSTLEPCVMCLGAAMEAGIDTVLFGMPAPFDGGAERVTPPMSPDNQMPRIIGNILAEHSRKLLREWLKTNPNPEQAKFVKQLLKGTKN